MKNIVAFAGSNSKASINKQLASYVANQVDNTKVKVLDLNNFELPLYGVDFEKEHGIPDNAKKFLEVLKSSDGIVVSLAEHNGAYASVFKNLFDWLSRAEQKTFLGKPMLLMATSPGARGGQSVLDIASDRFPRHNANIVSTFSLPSFNDNFSEDGIKDEALSKELKKAISEFESAL